MQNNYKQKITPSKRRAVSPILATVVLLGITVVGGGLAFTAFSTGASTAGTSNSIVIENAQAVKGTSHADLTATIKNSGSKAWTTVEMTVAKSDLSEPLLYESLHENVQGCGISTNSATAGNCNTSGAVIFSGAKLDNPLRSQWIAHLDKTGGTSGVADKDEGISAGRKFVISTSDSSIRSTTVPRSTSVAQLITGNNTASTNITTGLSCATGTAYSNCSALFAALDSSVKGGVYCKVKGTASTDDIECKVVTHQKIDKAISSGGSVQIYADLFTKAVPGLNNQFVQAGDNLVTNIVTKDADGGSARVQTIIKVTGA